MNGMPATLQEMEFKYEFRRYQSEILSQIGMKLGKESKFFILAPPGSGKTIVGLEMIKRLGHPTVVFAPTTTIAQQWMDKTKMFLEKEDAAKSLVSLESSKIKPINVYTYQRISTRGEATEQMRSAAEQMWITQLSLRHGKEEAQERIKEAKRNQGYYQKELKKYLKKVREESDKLDVKSCMHENARKLVDQLVKYGVKIVVLDECHHLLDYWALVIRQLIKAIGNDVTIIGLTATYPVREERELDNFYSILGEVDYEISVPAVVKEGFLAPYRELCYLVAAKESEKARIRNQSKAVAEAMDFFSKNEKFPEFIKWGDENSARMVKSNFFAYLSLEKFRSGADLVKEEKIAILEEFMSYMYKTISEEERLEISHYLKSKGMQYSVYGLRISRDVERFVLSYSDSRIDGAIEVAKKESRSLKEKLRMLIITDFDSYNPLASEVKEFDSNYGSAMRVFSKFIEDHETNKLDPILVTGKRIFIDSDIAEMFRKRAIEIAKQNGWKIKISIQDRGKHSEIIGSGKDWSVSTYVSLATKMFEGGISKILIGTKGIFAEGWDSLKLNTMIDLTAVSFGTSVQQARGRSIRLDPDDKEKVSHNWEVIVADSEMMSQIRKIEEKHGLIYGVCDDGAIARGLWHLDAELTRIRYWQLPGFLSQLSAVNNRMFSRMNDRGTTRELWDIGTSYVSDEYHSSKITVSKKMVAIKSISWFLFAVQGAFWAIIFSLIMAALNIEHSYAFMYPAIMGLFAFAFIIFFAIRNPMTTSNCSVSMAQALYNAMKKIGIVDDSCKLIINKTNSGISVSLIGRGGRAYSEALREIFDPPIKTRYLIEYDPGSMGIKWLGWLTATMLRLMGIEKRYFAVPSIFATDKDRAEIFLAYWKAFVGGYRVVYIHSDEGKKLLKETIKKMWLYEKFAEPFEHMSFIKASMQPEF